MQVGKDNPKRSKSKSKTKKYSQDFVEKEENLMPAGDELQHKYSNVVKEVENLYKFKEERQDGLHSPDKAT